MRVLITGAAGFIGFHLGLALRRRGDEVVGCDLLTDYYDPTLKRMRAALLQKAGAKFESADIRYPYAMEKLSESCDVIVHLAAQAGVRYAKENPQTYLDTNINGFLPILEVVRKRPSLPLIYASSSSVYGLNKKVPFAETDPTETPANLYAATKKSNELMAYAYHHLFGITAIGLRFFTVYGPWGRPDMAYYAFTEAIMNGTPIRLYNHGNMQRDFTYIDDIVEGVVAAIDTAKGCEIFNLGNSKPEPITELVRIIETHLGKKAKVELLPEEPGEVLVTYADISKSAARLGFKPTIGLEEGMSRFLQWFKDKK